MMDELAARVRRAVGMRLNGARWEQIARVCGYLTAAEAREAVNAYSDRWFLDG